jgi:hypothetical protein
MPRQRRHGRRAQRGQQGHFRQQHRIARLDRGQQAEGGDGLQPGTRVLGVSVDVFEAVERAVRGRHQLDHAEGRVAGHPRRLVEAFPAQEIGLDGPGEAAQHLVQPDPMDQAHHVLDGHEGHEGPFGRIGHA